MTRQAIIEKTIEVINQLPETKAEEISDFADFLFKKYEEESLIKGIKELSSKSKTYDFLKDDDGLYSVNDIKEKYNG